MTKRIGILLPLAVWASACSTTDPGKTNDLGNAGTTGTGGTMDDGGDDVDPIPASLEVSVDAYTGDVGQTFMVTVRVFNADGVELPDVGTDVAVADPATAEVLGPQVTFLTEGVFVVTATLDDGSLATDADPIRIDDNGPQIAMTSPASGAWLSGEEVEVTGTVTDLLAGVDTVTVQGEAVALTDDGSFSTTVPLSPGATAIEVRATDIDGNASDAWLGVMAGDALDPLESMPGLQVSIGGSGIEAIAAPLLVQLDDEAVEAAVKATNPIAAGSVSCVDYSANLRSVEYGTPALKVTPEDGAVAIEIELSDLEAVVRVTADVCGVTSVADNITLTDSLTTIAADVAMGYYPAIGGVIVGMPEKSVTYADLNVDYGTIDSALSFAGLSVSDLGIDVGAYLETVILEVVAAELPPPIVNALEAMAFSETLDVLGSVVELATEINAIEPTVDGVAVLLNSTSTGPAPDPELPELPGSLDLPGAPPSGDNSVNLALSLALDELNRILYLAHASGAFRIGISDEELGLDTAIIDFVFPGATTLNLTFEPTLPPVLTPSDTGSMLDLSMLSLQMEARGLVDGVDTELVTGFVHVLGSVNAGINAEGEIALEVTGITPVVDVETPDASGVAAAEGLEDTLATVSAGIIGDLFPAITFAIPEVEGMSLVGTGAETAGDAQTWVRIDADIVE
ncbi:MAG: hypothetical protein CL927_19245 [Deltaproteobacteria bacterium]|nr:hypothetical protein [Deltaproteobacteria bacterium]HCH61967.1 hypothetical protein [Deltaproteobacteria bacterium]